MAKTSDNTDLQPRKRTRNQTRGSASNPPPPNPQPTQLPQNQPPTYRRFTSDEAATRFEALKEFEFTAERGFELRKLTGYPTFEKTLIEKGWLNLNAMVSASSNKSIALEFFANAVSEREGSYVSRVRGKRIDFSAHQINRILGLRVPEVCDVQRRRLPANWPKSHEEWDEMIVGLMKEGQGWWRRTPGSNPQRINTAHLLPIPRAWASFILTTIASTSAAAEMITSRVFILLVLLSDHEEMNVGRLIAENLNDMVTKNTALGHCCLINLLCQEAGVVHEPADLHLKSQLPVTDSTMSRLEKKVERRAGAQHAPETSQQHQEPPEAEYPPMHPALAEYIYSSKNWMDEASSQLYIEPPRFSHQFSQMSLQYQRPPTGSFDRFGSRENMREYFQVNRERAARREQAIEQDFDYGENMEMAAAFAGGSEFGDTSRQDQQDQPDE